MGRDDGSLDLDAVLLEYERTDEPAMRKQLTDLEFERGLFLAWNDAQGFLVYPQIWQFRHEREAAAWSVAEARAVSDGAQSTASLDGILGVRSSRSPPRMVGPPPTPDPPRAT